jgi:ABC-2 type transport system permease protein
MSPMLRAEWVKLRTVASTGWLLLGVVLVTVAASTAADAASLCTSSAGCQPDATRLTLTGTGAGQSLAAVAGGLTLVAGAVAVLGSVLAGEPILPGHGLSLPAGPMMRAATGTVLYLALIALLSLGVATAVRDAAVAIGTVLGLLYVFPILGQVIADPAWHRHLEQLGPMTAGLEIQASTGLNHLPIGPWAGLGVLAAWAAAALLAGGLLLRFRDA